jgi:hypothetical protein
MIEVRSTCEIISRHLEPVFNHAANMCLPHEKRVYLLYATILGRLRFTIDYQSLFFPMAYPQNNPDPIFMYVLN